MQFCCLSSRTLNNMWEKSRIFKEKLDFYLGTVCLFWLSGTHISWIWAHLHKSLWPLEWGRIDAVLILHLYLKRPCRFLLNLLCFCNCHKTNVMGISVGGSSPANMPQPSEAWSRASAELQEQEKASLDQWSPSWPTDAWTFPLWLITGYWL